MVSGQEKLTLAGGVPSMVAQMVESQLSKGENTLQAFLFGGAPSSKNLVADASKAFPTLTMSQAYGLTETNSVAVSHAGEDYLNRPTSCGLTVPINDVVIMDVEKEVEMPVGQAGEIWLRGCASSSLVSSCLIDLQRQCGRGILERPQGDCKSLHKGSVSLSFVGVTGAHLLG